MSELLTQIKASVEATAGGIAEFKAAQEQRVAELQARIEDLEAKRSVSGMGGNARGAETIGDLAAKAIHDDLPALEKHKNLRFELKAAGDPVTTSAVRSIVFGGIDAPRGGVLGLQNGLPSRRIDGGSVVEYSRYTGVEGAAAQQATEGSAKAAITPTYSIISQTALTLAGYSKISRQALQDQGEVRNVVNTVLMRSLNTALDVALTSGATGFTNGYEGLATAYTSLVYTPLPDAVSEAVSTMQVAGFSPNVVFLNPADWLKVCVAKGTANDHYLSGSYLGALPTEMRGLRVVLSPSVDAGKALVADTAHCELVYVGGMTIEAAYSGDDFTKNLLTVLAEVRVAPVFRTTGAMRLITPKA
jgi:hypothetical protein